MESGCEAKRIVLISIHNLPVFSFSSFLSVFEFLQPIHSVSRPVLWVGSFFSFYDLNSGVALFLLFLDLLFWSAFRMYVHSTQITSITPSFVNLPTPPPSF